MRWAHFLGRAVYLLSPRYRNRVLENLGSSGLCPNREALHALARQNAAEIGKGATELAWALFRPLGGSRRRNQGTRRMGRRGEAAREGQAGHLRHAASRRLRRSWAATSGPRSPASSWRCTGRTSCDWFDRLMREGRDSGLGARQHAHRHREHRGRAQGPQAHARRRRHDRAARPGARRRRRRVGRILRAPGVHDDARGAAPAVRGRGDRLLLRRAPARTAKGFIVHFRVLEAVLPRDRHEATLGVNRGIEEVVRMCPVQYLWGYNRYKRPAGAPPPPAYKVGRAG